MSSITVGPYTIPSDTVEDSADAFLFINPIPESSGLNAAEWFEEWLRLRLVKELAQCRFRYAESQISYIPANDNDVVVGGG